MAQNASAASTFKLGRSVSGNITLLELQGVLDEAFEGRKVAETVRTKRVVMDLSKVRRFASWGMSQWADFIKLTANRDVYVVECSTQAVNQFNLVTGLLGHAKLVSFYTGFRCGKCGEESESLLVVPTDRDNLADAEQTCRTCGGSARMDKYTATLCAAIAEQAAFDLDDDVIALLRSQYRYNITPDVRRFRAYRRATKDAVYLRLTGEVNGAPAEPLAKACEATTVVDTAGLTLPSLEPRTFAPWRAFVRAALPNVTSLQLLDCPVGFLERAVVADDFPKLKVRTFRVDYACERCNTSQVVSVDVAKELEHLIDGRLPAAACPTCKEPAIPLVSTELANLVRRLPAREHDPALDKLVDKARAEPAQALEDAFAERPEKPAKTAGGGARALYIASALMVAVTAVLIALGLGLWKDRDNKTTTTGQDPNAIVAPRPLPTVERPDWILSDLPLSAFCHDLVNRLMCVGVSGYRRTQEEGLVDANEAALEELLHTVALRATDPFFRDNVLPLYSDTRSKALAAVQVADTDRTSQAYTDASAALRASRKQVVELLRASGGPAVPAQRSDWYWEEYAVEKGPQKTETLVFVRYDVPLDVVKALVDKYSVAVPLLGGSVISAFPALSWRDRGLASGAMVATTGGELEAAQIKPPQVISAIGGTAVTDASDLAKRVGESPAGPVELTIKSTDGAAPKTITVKH